MENKSTIQTQRTSTVLSALLAHLVGLRSHNAAFLPPLSKFRISDIGHRISMTAIFFLALLTSQNALAQCSQVATATQNMTWTGTASTDWNNPCNWSPNGIPTATNQTIINNVTNDPVVLSGTTAVTKEIYVTTGAMLTVNSGGTLNVNITPVPNCITMQGVGSSIINNGTINTGTGDGFGFVTEATSTITNRGTINTNQGLASAIVAGRGNLTFTNESTGIVNGSFRAIDGFGLTLTNRGTVNYSGSTYVLVLRSNGPSSVVNDGTIQCTAGLGIENQGGSTITNSACGKILVSAGNYINRSTTTNAGLISISNNLDNTGGTFTNTGVLKYGSTSGNAVTNNQNSSVIVNNTLPIFTYGSSFNGTVNGIFTNAAATTSAGTFTAPNTFVPSGLPAGSQTLYAKITPSSGACSYIVPFTYQNGCSQVATATQSMTWTGAVSTDWNNPCNWSPNGIPTATNPVNIPATTNDPIISSGTSVAHIVGISGSGASLTVNSGATLTVSSVIHDGVLGISNGGLLTNRGTINVAQTYPNGSWYAILMGANGTLDNYGALNLTAPLNIALFVHAGATLNNRSGGHISISNSGRGINLEGTLINQSGATITLSNAAIGVTGGILNNSGNIEATVEIGNASSGQIINNACGILKHTGSFFNSATSTTTNAGLILISNGLFNTGTFTNNGVLKYNILGDNAIVNNQNSSVIVNNSLPIFTYGSSFNGTINGIFTNAAATTSAGTFTAPNTFVPSGLPFGSQTLYAKITPSGGACSYVVPFTYNNAPPTLSAGNVTNPTTCGGTGSIAFTTTDVANGTYWLSFTTTGTSSPQNVTVTNNAFTLGNLLRGDYSNFSLNVNGTNATTNVTKTVNAPAAPTISGLSQTNILCNGGTTGGFTFSVSGGAVVVRDAANNIIPTTGANPYTVTGRAAGAYLISVNNGCTTSQSVTLTQPSTPLSMSTAQTNVTTNGGNNGTITVTASGGTSAFQFSKDGGSTYTSGTSPFTFNFLTAATYQIRVKDANGCETANSAVTITQPTAVNFTTTPTNIACNGASTGAIQVNVSAGTGPYQFSKDDGATFTTGTNPNPFTFNGLAAGTYKIKVRDQTGFVTAASSVVLTQPTPLSLSTTQTNVSVNGGNNGKITVTASGGTGANQFSKNGGSTYTAGASPFEFNTLTAATYQIRVKDANGCETANSAVTITQPTAVSFTTTKTNILCNGASTGTIQVSASAGVAPYQYSKDDGATFTTGTNPNPFTFNGLAAGTYKIKVKDNTGFITTASSVVLTQPTPLSISITDVDVTMNGGNNGKITVTASGGTGALQFSKNGGTTYTAGTSPFEFTALTAATYQIRVKDANGCETANNAVIISQPVAVSFTTTKTNILCNGASTGTIQVTVSAGTSPYQFSKDDGATFTAGTSPFTFNGLAAGTYKIKVKDNTGFITAASSVTLTQPSTPLSLSTAQTNVSINGGNNGKITVTASGGTGALQFSKNGGTTYTAGTSPFDFTALTAATYQIRVKDANGCETANSAVAITQPVAVSFTTTKTNILCNGASTGTIQVTVSAGTSPYQYSKDDGATFTTGTNPNPFTFNGLAAGTYKIKVKDNTGFITAASSVTLTQPSPLSISTTDVDVTINGGNNGKITVTASGGTGALQFSKNGGTTYTAGTSPYEFTALTAGTYQIRVKDANGCETANNAVIITQPVAVSFTTTKTNILCNGASTGTIQVTVSAGTSPYQFSKDDGATFTAGTTPFTFSGLAAGTYKIKVKDNTGFITAASSVTLTQPSTPLSLSTAQTNVSINGGNNGKITVTASGGTGALQFSKNGGTTYTAGTSPFDFNTLTAATYQIRVKDANGCQTANSAVTITQPTAVSFTTTKTNITCNGASTGAIQVNASAGVAPYQFSKDDGATFTTGTTPFTFNGLAAGTYKIKVKDQTGFTTTASSVTLTQPTVLSVSTSETDVTINGGNDGKITVTASGGTGALQFSKDGGTTYTAGTSPFEFNTLTAGTYEIRVKDANGCETPVNEATITQPTAVNFSSTRTFLTCYGSSTGKIQINVTAGTSPFEFSKDDGATFTAGTSPFTFNSLAAGTYKIKVKDNTGFTTTASSVVLPQPAPLSISTSDVDVSINGGNNGKITVTASGGTGALQFSKDGGTTYTAGTSPFEFNTLTAATYQIRIKDAKDCESANNAVAITQPTAVSFITDKTDIACNGASTGAIEVDATAGTGPFEYSKDDGATFTAGTNPFTFNDLMAETYKIKVKDQTGFITAASSVTLNQPTALSLSTAPTNVSVNGGNDGKIIVTASGGTGALQFSKDGGTIYTAGTSPFEFDMLTAGTYQIRVEDANGCQTANSEVTISQPTAVNFSTSKTNIACNGASTGTIQVTVTNGTSPFEFSKDNGSTFTAGTSPFTFNGLAAGTYRIKVKDNTGFITAASSVTLTQPTPLSMSTSDLDVSINGGNNGKITVTASGGTGALQFSKDGGANYSAGTSPFEFTNLTANTYQIRVKDANGCETTASAVTISEPTTVNFTTDKTDITCNGTSTGEIDINVTNGTSPFQFSKDDGATFTAGTNPFTFNSLAAGTYKIKVKDQTGFITSASSITLNQPTALSLSTDPTNITINGGNDGKITVTASGGTGALQFSKDGGTNYAAGTSPFEFNILSAATYQIRVKDANGCETANSEVTINQPTAVNFTTSKTNVACNGASTGSIQVNVTNGTTPFEFSKDDGATFTAGTNPFTFNGLAAGTYKIKVKDNTGFITAASSVALTQPAPLSMSTTDVDVSINGGNNGKITVTASGGTGALQFSKDGGTTYLAGTSPFEFNTLTAATYQIRVKDANGCETANNAVTITQPTTVNFTTDKSDITCNGTSTGEIEVYVTNGTSPFEYSKDDGVTFATGTNPFTFNGLAAATYKIKVKDNTGFVTSATSVTLTQPTPLSMSTSKMDVTVNGGDNGKITVTAGGGAGALQFSKDGGTNYTAGTSPFDFTTLTAATYQIRVKDANGCETANSAVTITQPTAVNFTTTPINIACNGASTGSIQVNVTNGTSPFEYSKDDGATFSAGTNPFTFNGLAADVYKIKVKDNTGFVTLATSVTITQPTALSISVGSKQDKDCSNAMGSVTLTVSGGTGSLQVSLNGGNYQSGLTFNNLAPNSYTATVKDANNCTQTVNFTINDIGTTPSAPSVSNVFNCLNAPPSVLTASGTNLKWYTDATGGTGTTTAPTPSTATVGTVSYWVSQTSGLCESGRSKIDVTTRALPSVSITGLNAAYCKSASAVTLTGSPSGGSFKIDGNAATQFDPSVLTVGNHTVVYSYSDGNGCANSTSQMVAVNALPVVSITGLNAAYCKSASAVTLTGSPSGGSFKIDGNTATQFDPSVLTVGNHTVVYTYSDGNGCANSTSQTVTVNALPVFNPSTVQNVLCNGGTTGKITVSTTGNNAQVQFSINPNNGVTQSPSGTFSGLTARTYTFTAVDAAGCSNTTTEQVTQPTALAFTGNPSVTNVTCSGGSDGRVVLAANGGTGAISYSINPTSGQQNPAGTFNGLIARNYTFTATDANSCQATTTATVGTRVNTPPTISLTSPTNGSVFATNKTITVNASDPDGSIARVNFYLVYYGDKTPISRTLLGSSTTAPFSFEWHNILGGNYNIQAEAIDNCGSAIFSTVVNVIVLETCTVLITSPTTGQGFVPGSNLTLAASVVSFTNRTITKVEFYKDNVKLGEDLTAPYTYSWMNVPSGSYYLRAVATDNMGSVWYSPYTYILGINPSNRNTATQTSTSTVFTLFPNPTNSQVNLRTTISEEGNYNINIVDMIGRVVIAKQNSYAKGDLTESLDVSSLAKGIYMVRFVKENGKDATTQKLIIE